jgi:cytochrome oxidase assembly protein ShyY1
VRFLLSRRWLIFFVTVALAAWGAYALGQWQFHRLHDKREANHRIQRNLAAPPVPVSALLHVGRPGNPDDEWRRVTVHGRWDDAHTVVVKYQTSATGAPGVHVATPLVTPGGAAVVVDRGWMQTTNNGDTRPTTPKPDPGLVTVTGWVRENAGGGAATVTDLATRALSSAEVAKQVPYPVYGNVVDLARQSPTPARQLGAIEMPDDTGDGPHFFYGLQWWFFGGLAIFGFFFLMYDERQRALAAKTGSQRPQHPAVDREHHAGQE